MDTRQVTPVAAFDIADGNALPVQSPWPDPCPGSGYRWLHFDLNDATVANWAKDHLPEIAAAALVQTETRPRCERLGDGLILNLRAVNLNPESEPEDMVSLRMWVTEGSVVSARLRRIYAVDAIRLEAVEGRGPATVGAFLADLTHGLTNRIETVSLRLEEETDRIEDEIADGAHPPADRLADIRQAVIKIRRFVNPQREAIAALAGLEGWILGPDELALLRETSNRTRRIVEELDATRERLSALQDSIEAERALALGRNSYVLSVVAAIFLPLGFLTGLFGVNVAGMPGVETPAAFWILSGVSAAIGLALFLIFKFSKWL